MRIKSKAWIIKLESQSLFYWIIYSYNLGIANLVNDGALSQSLFYWIIYSYEQEQVAKIFEQEVSILILLDYLFLFF